MAADALQVQIAERCAIAASGDDMEHHVMTGDAQESPPSLEDLLMHADRLTPMPAVVIKLLDVLRDANANFDRVAQVIARDQAITATVLKLANSPLYRGRQQIDTVSHAVSRIGMVSLRDVVLAATVLKLPGRSLVQVERIRKELLAAGTAARLLAGHCRVNVERAFVAGLLQDVGRFLITAVDAPTYFAVTQDEMACSPSFVESERRWLGFTHAEVGAALAEQWRFPDFLVATIAHQNNPAEAEDPEVARMSSLGSLGAKVGIRLVRRAPAMTPEEMLATDEGKLLGLRPVHVDNFSAKFEDEFESMSRVFHL